MMKRTRTRIAASRTRSVSSVEAETEPEAVKDVLLISTWPSQSRNVSEVRTVISVLESMDSLLRRFALSVLRESQLQTVSMRLDRACFPSGRRTSQDLQKQSQ